MQAAQSAFKVLSKQFVITGHFQGGGAPWEAAQRQFLMPVDGYMGSVAGSPVTNLVDTVGAEINSPPINSAAALDPSSILTPTGLKWLTMQSESEIQGCNSVAN